MNLFSQKKIVFIVGLFGFLFVFSNPLYAGGGRIEIENFNGTGYSGQSGLYIQTKVLLTKEDWDFSLLGYSKRTKIPDPTFLQRKYA